MLFCKIMQKNIYRAVWLAKKYFLSEKIYGDNAKLKARLRKNFG